ncbi:hypothetical protein A3Q56_07077, partial [Intoshia linei]
MTGTDDLERKMLSDLRNLGETQYDNIRGAALLKEYIYINYGELANEQCILPEISKIKEGVNLINIIKKIVENTKKKLIMEWDLISLKNGDMIDLESLKKFKNANNLDFECDSDSNLNISYKSGTTMISKILNAKDVNIQNSIEINVNPLKRIKNYNTLNPLAMYNQKSKLTKIHTEKNAKIKNDQKLWNNYQFDGFCKNYINEHHLPKYFKLSLIHDIWQSSIDLIVNFLYKDGLTQVFDPFELYVLPNNEKLIILKELSRIKRQCLQTNYKDINTPIKITITSADSCLKKITNQNKDLCFNIFKKFTFNVEKLLIEAVYMENIVHDIDSQCDFEGADIFKDIAEFNDQEDQM